MVEIYNVTWAEDGTVDATLRQGDLYVRCEGIGLWDEELCDEAVFEEWVEYADAGEDGYSKWRAIAG